MSYAAAARQSAAAPSATGAAASSSALAPGALSSAAAALLSGGAPPAPPPGAAAAAAAAGAPLKPSYPALASSVAAAASSGGAGAVNPTETRAVRVPSHRLTPLKDAWEALVKPVTEHLRLLVRYNPRARAVELKPSPFTTDAGALQRAEDFVRAFVLGFEPADALALLRLDELYVESFEVTDVKPLKGDHLSRAIGRIAGAGGKTRIAIENATRTRIVVADAKIHVLGAFANIAVARDAVCALIMGAPPGKVYSNMSKIAHRVR